MAKAAFSHPTQILGRIVGNSLNDGKRSRNWDHSTVPKPEPLNRPKTGTVMGGRPRLRDVDDFPVGTRVITPLGRPGVVIKHKGAESEEDAHERCVIQYQLGRGFRGEDRNMVTLLPSLLVKAGEGQGGHSYA